MSGYFTNKEISWLSFNARVLQEAADPSVPLASRIMFMGIYSSNMDEFFRVRVATLKRLSYLGAIATDIIGADPKEILKSIEEIVLEQQKKFAETFTTVLSELEERDIYLINEKELNEEQEAFVQDYLDSKVRSKLFPIIVHRRAPFPVLLDKSIYFAVEMRLSSKPEKKPKYCIIEVPTATLPRFLMLPSNDGKKYIIMLDDVIRAGLKHIFAMFKFDTFEAFTIKLTRDAELDIDDDIADSYLSKMNKGLKRRKLGNPVRFVYDKGLSEDFLQLLVRKLKLKRNASLIPGGRYHNFRDFMKFPDVVGDSKKEYPTQLHHKDIEKGASVIAAIRKKDIMLHPPYQSFNSFIDFLREASIDPCVRSIKVTLYRVADNSSVANALINALKNGKEVTAVIELQARFDEESNIYWSNKLREEGAKVIFGVRGLKVHSKLCLVKRRERGRFRYYACIGTGNFNEDTAKLYTDSFLLTCDKGLTSDVRKVFNFFDNNYRVSKYRNLIVSPFTLRQSMTEFIDNEIANAKKGKDAYILLKLNNLSDKNIIDKLYEASSAGVKMRLIVRSMFSLVPGIKDVSENIEAKCIVDKYLEHTRLIIFCNGGDERYFISSADWLPRNFDKRVEITCPIYSKEIKKELRDMFEIQWKDTVKNRILNASLDNAYATGDERIRAQDVIYDYFKERHGEA